MTKMKLFVLMMFGTLSWAAANPEDYSIKVHVSACHWVVEPTTLGPGLIQRLNVTIDGKKYELDADFFGGNPTRDPLLDLGDYKAKLVRDVHHNAYEYSQTYEFLFPDNKTRKFVVIGQTER